MTSDARDVNDRRRKSSSTSYLALGLILLLSLCSLHISLSIVKEMRKTTRTKEEEDPSSITSRRPSSNDTGDYVGDEDGASQEDIEKYDEELLRMVRERKTNGARRGKVAWLMR